MLVPADKNPGEGVLPVKALENLLERLMWSSRYIVVLPVLISLLLAIGMIVVTTFDALGLLASQISYLTADSSLRSELSVDNLVRLVAIIDNYLLAAILIIFALGLYELFIAKIDKAETSELGRRLLLIQSLDDLKDRLASVILLVLIVKFFQQALRIKYSSAQDLLLLALGVILLAGALYLSGRAKPKDKVEKVESEKA